MALSLAALAIGLVGTAIMDAMGLKGPGVFTANYALAIASMALWNVCNEKRK